MDIKVALSLTITGTNLTRDFETAFTRIPLPEPSEKALDIIEIINYYM